MIFTSKTLPVAAIVAVEILIAFCMGFVRVTYIGRGGGVAVSGYPSLCDHNLLPKICNKLSAYSFNPLNTELNPICQ